MTTTLTGNPLRTSPVMFAEPDDVPEVRAPEGPQPLAYLYADWDPDPTDELDPVDGFYDPDSQTWIQSGGVITAGHWTTSRPGTHQIIDDSCA